VLLEGYLAKIGHLSLETLEALLCAKVWLIDFNDAKEGNSANFVYNNGLIFLSSSMQVQ
jgi:hypothetical protein